MNPLWSDICSRASISLTDEMAAKLNAYLDKLLTANETMNLTRIESREQAELLHIADSLTILPFLPSEPRRLADVGSGGGLPGIPIAIVRPDVRVTLIDATQKKAAFLEQTARELDLPNIRVIADRSENLRGHQWDVVTARALAAMDKLVGWCLPLVRPGGTLLAMKGPRGRDELSSAEKVIKRLRGEAAVVHDANLPGRQHLVLEIRRRGGEGADSHKSTED